MALNVVSNIEVVNMFKKSKFFRKNLGLVSSIDKNGNRVANEKDRFAHYYNTNYKTTIFAHGNVGDIKFYTDYYIQDESFAVYPDNLEEYIFKFDFDLVKEKGIDFYLGHLLKKVDEMYEERVKNNELKKMEPKPQGNPENVFKNPGNVTYADLKAYLAKKNAERYKKFE
jgi:hypothetical protein